MTIHLAMVNNEGKFMGLASGETIDTLKREIKFYAKHHGLKPYGYIVGRSKGAHWKDQDWEI